MTSFFLLSSGMTRCSFMSSHSYVLRQDSGKNIITENWLKIIIGSVSSYKLFYTNSVAANRTNFFMLSKSCRTDDISHFYFVDIFPTEHVLTLYRMIV
jgi:hypothetical protein